MNARDHEELSAAERFALTYARSRSEAELLVEREVFGACIGTDGYTTIREADQLFDCLALGPGQRLLDLGSGRGWPGTHLAEQSGCDVVLTDVPVEASREAQVAAHHRDLAGHVTSLAAAGEALPFRSQVFDAIVHSDAFC